MKIVRISNRPSTIVKVVACNGRMSLCSPIPQKRKFEATLAVVSTQVSYRVLERRKRAKDKEREREIESERERRKRER